MAGFATRSWNRPVVTLAPGRATAAPASRRCRPASGPPAVGARDSARLPPRPRAGRRRSARLPGAAASLTIRALPWQHAFCPAAPYLAAPTDPSLARPPLVTEGHFLCKARGWKNGLRQSESARAQPGSRQSRGTNEGGEDAEQARQAADGAGAATSCAASTTIRARSRRSGRSAGRRMDLFRASDDPADDRPRTYVLDMFPYPSGDLHMGHAEAYAIGDAIARYWFQRGYNVLHPIGWDAFGLPAENAAIRSNAHPADWTYKNIETQAASFRRYAISFDWSPAAAHLRPGVLPLDPVAVPAVLRARAGLPQGRLRQLVPEGPDGAGQRAGHRRAVRAVRHRGRPADADPVVLQDHRVRRPAAGRHGAAGGQVARAGAADAAQLDRPQRGRRGQFAIEGRDEPVTVFTTRPGHAVRGDVLRGRGRLAAGRRAVRAGAARHELDALPDPGAQADRHRAAGRPTGRRPACSWAGTRSTRSTASGSRSGPPTTCCPTTAPARSWRCPRTTSATWTSPGRSGCRCGSSSRPAGPIRRETGMATAGDGMLVNSGPLDGLTKAEAIAAITEILAPARPGPGRGQLPAARLAAVAAAVLGRADPDRALRGRAARSRCPTTSCRCVLPDLRGQDLAPKGVSPLAARRATG